LVTLRRALLVLLVIALALLAAVFAYSNPDPITVDIGIARLEGVSMSVAFACAFGFGWLFGLVCAGTALWRMARDRRRLKRQVRMAEAEISGLRSMPLQDAN
jgi:lipopolysaccharide assembly protein A